MKIKALVIGVVSALSLTASLAHAAATPEVVNGGTIHFKGEVVTAACAVDAGSVDQTVQMGQVQTSSFSAAGSTSSPVGFNIQLDNCDTTTYKTASINFLGTQATDSSGSTLNNVLALQSSSAGSATNVGIQILNSTGEAVSLNVADPTSISGQTLINGTNTLPFQARYYATNATVGAGTADADATFQVVYQ